MRGLWIFFAILLFAGCGPRDRRSPDSAFSRLSGCIDAIDARCLFAELDRDSRWSIETIHKVLHETRAVVAASYPFEMKASALGSWAQEAEADDAVGMFEVFCNKRRCLETIARGFGAVVGVKRPEPSLAEVETTRGERFVMAEADGEWGLAVFREYLQRAKLRSYDRLKQIKLNATEYEQQRLASGRSGSDSNKEK